MKNTFKKGLILGGLLAAGATLGFAMSKEGRHMTEELQTELKTLARHLKKDLHKLEDVTKESFDALVVTIVDEYIKKKELASDIKQALIEELQAKWSEMESEYSTDKDETTK